MKDNLISSGDVADSHRQLDQRLISSLVKSKLEKNKAIFSLILPVAASEPSVRLNL